MSSFSIIYSYLRKERKDKEIKESKKNAINDKLWWAKNAPLSEGKKVTKCGTKKRKEKVKSTNRQTDKPTKVQYITQGWTL